MITLLSRRVFLASMITCTGFAILGCGSKLEGKYVNATGLAAIELKSGKAYLTLGAVTQQAEYVVTGNKIIIRESKDDKEPIILTRNGDGSIDTPFGRMTRKGS